MTRSAWLVVLLYLVLAISYGLVTPLFEAPDEHHHYFTVEAIATTGRLPTATPPIDPYMRQEAAQPPLYYVLGALLISPLDLDPAGSRQALHFNPYIDLDNPPNIPFNLNAFVHDPAGAPYTLPAHILRLFSTLLGASTLICIHAAGRKLWPQHPQRALIAITFIALLPQYTFIHSAISNDPLITFLTALALYQIITLPPENLRRHLLLGLTIGLSALTKNQGILLLPLALLFPNPKSKIQNPKSLLILILPVLAMAGWLYLRNWQLYGDPTATTPFIELAGGNRHATLPQLIGDLPLLWESLFARFGWMNITSPNWLLAIWSGIVTIAIAGHIRRTRRFSWLILWPLIVFATLLSFMQRTPAAQGRLLFPALLPLALGLAYGIAHWQKRWLTVGLCGLAGLTTLYSLFFTLPQAYAHPLITNQLPMEATPIHADLGQGLQLVGAMIETDSTRPGQPIHLTLYWQTDNPPTEPPIQQIRLLGRDFVEVGRVIGYHGRGLFPANHWQSGQLIVDRFAVELDTNFALPTQVIPEIRLLGEETAVALSPIKVAPDEWPEPPDVALVDFSGIQLVSAELVGETRPGQTLTLDLTWHITQPPNQNLTTFVHLLDENSNLITTGDAPPLRGHYPTHLWETGEQFDDLYTLTIPEDIPAGTYTLTLGFYDPTTGIRRESQPPHPNNAYPLTQVEIKN